MWCGRSAGKPFRGWRTNDPHEVVILSATTVAAAADPLVVLQGGPGQSATRLADFYARVMSRVRERRDIVLIDALLDVAIARCERAAACSEVFPRLRADLELVAPRLRSMRGETFLGDYRVQQQQQACDVWPQGEAMPDARTPVRSDTPVLLISGTDDPVTPPQFAEEVARSLPNSRHVVVPNHGHPMGKLEPCAAGFMAEFVEKASARNLDLSCAYSTPPSRRPHAPGPRAASGRSSARDRGTA